MKSLKTLVLFLFVCLAIGCAVHHKKGSADAMPPLKTQTPNAAAIIEQCAVGEKLYQSNCTPCHFLNRPLIGPPLNPSVANKDKVWLIKFIHNSKAIMESGDTAAQRISAKYHNLSMPAFPRLTDADIEAIIAYASNCSEGKR